MEHDRNFDTNTPATESIGRLEAEVTAVKAELAAAERRHRTGTWIIGPTLALIMIGSPPLYTMVIAFWVLITLWHSGKA